MAAIGLVHPGAMGSVVGGLLVAAGHDVRWASAGRSQESHRRAEDAGLEDAGDLARLVAGVDTLLSVVPPAAAEEVARDVVVAGFRGRYLDANAIAPATARRLAEVVEGAGAVFVDGGIVGGPPRQAGTTRLYLAGVGAGDVAGWFAGTALEAIVVEGRPGAASAVKAAYAGWTKGSGALLLAVRSLARHEGVEDVLLAEWARSMPGLADRSTGVAAGVHRKAWRFEGEMREIAAALDAAGLPPGFHQAAAAVYERLADLRHEADDQPPGQVLDRIPTRRARGDHRGSGAGD